MIGGQVATTLLEGGGDSYRWSIDLEESLIEGTATSLSSASSDLEESLQIAASERLFPRHQGPVYASYDRVTGEGIVLEVRKGKLADAGLRLPSKRAAEEYVAAVRDGARLYA